MTLPVFKSIAYNGQVQCVWEKNFVGMGKGDMVKSGFGEFQGVRRKHSVIFGTAKCVHTTLI